MTVNVGPEVPKERSLVEEFGEADLSSVAPNRGALWSPGVRSSAVVFSMDRLG